MGNNKAVEIIRSKADGRHPRVGIILGTGLGPFAENVENKIINVGTGKATTIKTIINICGEMPVLP